MSADRGVAMIVRRVPPQVRERIRQRAREGYTSMNTWILQVLDRESARDPSPAKGR